KVALEVKVSHGCEPEKVKDFLEHNIPIIEINITEKLRFKEELNKQPFDENDLERYYNFLKSIFSNKVYGRIVVDPSSDAYNQRLIYSEKQRSSKLKEMLESEVRKSNFLNQQLANSNNNLQRNKDYLDAQNAKLKEYSKILKELKSRTLLKRIFDLFR
ncbi:hypothetical protein, partial [Shewanella algae]|uniref:hypothetical protein n=1 Tax=Shewanella algae TaxID=38313 RepID=UPI001F1ED663